MFFKLFIFPLLVYEFPINAKTIKLKKKTISPKKLETHFFFENPPNKTENVRNFKMYKNVKKTKGCIKISKKKYSVAHKR